MWQPIESAPLDAIIVAAWHEHSKSWCVGEAHWVEHDDTYANGSWWWANVGPGDYHGNDIINMGGKPMYWQPMPEPPTDQPSI